MSKHPLLVITSAMALAALGALASACGGSSHSAAPGSGAAAADPIRALAGAATSDALNMERHAAMMRKAAVARADGASWAGDADVMNANARSLRVISDAAMAIARDPGSQPRTAVELRRVLGDGRNLQDLGQQLIAHCDAMQAHLDAMRAEVADDSELAAEVEMAGAGIDDMKVVGQAAIDRGEELQETAMQIADNTGQDLD
jgi:hypothetical protein